MNDRNRKLLDEVIEVRLERALVMQDDNNESASVIFKEAMEAVDKSIEIDRNEAVKEEATKKLEAAEKEAEKSRKIKYLEIGAAVIIAPIVGTLCNKAYAKLLCEFEKDYTFTTSAGRALSKLFSFGKK